MIIKYIVPILLAAGIMAVVVFAQVYRYRKVSLHPWKDVFSHKYTFIMYVILRIIALFALFRALARHDYESAFCCALAMILYSMPMLVEKWFKIEFSPVMEVIVLLFIYASEILGEVENYYVRIQGWDTALHTMNGFLCAAIGFALADMLNRSDTGVKLTPIYLAVVAFCFSMTVGVLWEFLEFTGDRYLAVDMQKDFVVQSFHSVTLDETNSNIPVSVKNIEKTVIYTADGDAITIDGGYLDIGIGDTMKDLMVNCLGAIIFSTVGYVGLKKGKNSRLARAFVPLVKRPKDIIRDVQDERQNRHIDLRRHLRDKS